MRRDALLLFGMRVRELRSEKAISQEELAALTKLERTDFSGIERGKPLSTTVACLVDYFARTGAKVSAQCSDGSTLCDSKFIKHQ